MTSGDFFIQNLILLFYSELPVGFKNPTSPLKRFIPGDQLEEPVQEEVEEDHQVEEDPHLVEDLHLKRSLQLPLHRLLRRKQ